MELTFEKWEDGRWFVVLPEYEGDQDDLEMVENADKMCDALSDDGLYVTLELTTDKPEGDDYFTLEIKGHDPDGAYYSVEDCDRFEGDIWLCNVTHYVFEEHPDTIYCKLVD